ncbi:MAG: alpha/beta fold hydrolase [Planctomycetota bacterium]|nr:alpha/beta fold hydrolase [Planctomycetota bacterium]
MIDPHGGEENTSSIEIACEDGWVLRGVYHPAFGQSRGALVMGHAMMVDSRSLDRPAGSGLASLLASRGFETYRFDFRGHGKSEPRTAKGPDWSYDDIVFRDIPAMIAAVSERHPDLPMGMIGHSLAGHAGLVRMGQEPELPVKAFVALATNIWAPPFEPTVWKRFFKSSILGVWHLLARGFGYFPSRRFRIGPADVSVGMIAQCSGWFRRGGYLALDGTDFLMGLRAVKIPVLSVTAEKDRFLAPTKEVDRLMGHLTSSRVEHWVVPGTHMSIVCDPMSQPLWRRLADWFENELCSVADSEATM